MGKKLNISSNVVTDGVFTNLLNGAIASLAGPIGFTLEQPRIIVTHIQVINTASTLGAGFAIYKGASGGHAVGTEVAYGSANASSSVEIDTDIVLDAEDFLTGRCIGPGSLTINISAEIEF
jgi:hypothetical protein